MRIEKITDASDWSVAMDLSIIFLSHLQPQSSEENNQHIIKQKRKNNFSDIIHYSD
jgi:hypothetical protein